MYVVGEDLLRAFCKLLYLRFWVLSDQWKSICVAKFLQAVWEIFLCRKNCNCDTYKSRYKFVFLLFSSFFHFLENSEKLLNGDLLIRSPWGSKIFSEAVIRGHPHSAHQSTATIKPSASFLRSHANIKMLSLGKLCLLCLCFMQVKNGIFKIACPFS